MKFEEVKRFGGSFWFSGVYKIVKYDYSHNNGGWCNPHYQCYLISPYAKNWGDYVDGAQQGNKSRDFTFEECLKMCEEHAKSYTPEQRQLKQAGIAQAAWAN